MVHFYKITRVPETSFRVRCFLRIVPLLLLCLTATGALAQDQRISVNLREASLEELMRDIESKTPYRFVYRSNEAANVRGLSVNARNQRVAVILNEILKGTGLGYTFTDNQIVIVPAAAGTTSEGAAYRVTGVVVDETGKNMPGVTVRVKGQNRGVATDREGRFIINFNSSERPTLVFSFIGYNPQEIAVNGNEELRVDMQVDVKQIDDVVVTGMITRPRESYVGAVTTLTKEELKLNYSRNLLQTISSLEPSFRMIQDNNMGSDPNRVRNFEIRGASSLISLTDLQLGNRGTVNTPLFILDGFEVDIQRVNDLNMEEVESVNILKDASATALYGSRGANGVVVITTSVPEEGKLRISYSGSAKLEIPDLSSYQLLSASEKLNLETELGLWDYYPEMLEYYQERIAAGVNTDWMRIPVRTGLGQEHAISVNGGSPEWKFGIDANLNKIVGAMKGSDRTNFNGNVKMSYNKNRFLFTNTLGIGYNTNSDSPYDDFSAFVLMNRYWEPFDEDGEAIYDYAHPASPRDKILNPAYNATKNYWRKGNYTAVRNNLSLGYDLLDNLRIRGSFGINRQITFSDYFRPPSHQLESSYVVTQRGTFSRTEQVNNLWNAKLQVNYILNLKDEHLFTFDVIGDMEEKTEDRIQWSVKGFGNDFMDHPANAVGYPPEGVPSGNETTTHRIGMVGAFNYTYKMKYLLDANVRYEGSSSFGKESRWAPFYSFGAGWNASKEKFIEDNVRLISLLRFRYSYGISGNLNFSPSQAMTVYQILLDQHYLGQIPAWIEEFGNPGLKWQTTHQHNASIDLSLFDNKVEIGINYYNKLTVNTVSNMDLPISHGYRDYVENVGKIRNTGWEYRARVNIVKNENLNWAINGSFSSNKNVLVKMSEALKNRLEDPYWSINTKKSSDNIYYKIKEGESIDAMYALRTAGIDPATGMRVYIDKDGRKSYHPGNLEDEVCVGNRQPKLNGSFGTTIYYKGFTASITFTARFGGKQFNQTLMNKVENINLVQNLDRRVLTEKWQKPGDIAAYKGMEILTPSYVTDAFVMRDNTLECSTIYLGYMFPNRIISRIGLSSLIISTQFSDVFYLSTIKRERGLDYPFSRNPNFKISFLF